jgi:hypothetical protein
MARISGTAGPSSADVTTEIATLIKVGKASPATSKLNEWGPWKVS